MTPTCAHCGSESAYAAKPCCSAHGAFLCHQCYRLSHFVESCSPKCAACIAEGLPTILTRRISRSMR